MTLLPIDPHAPRPVLQQLTEAQIRPLDALLVGIEHETWREMAISNYLCLLGWWGQRVDHALLAQIALELVKGAAANMGGKQWYMPSGYFIASDARAQRIIHGFTGRNHQQLAQQEGVTEMRVRQILADWEREQFERRQHKLPL